MAFSWQESVKPAGTQDIQCDIEYLDKSYIHVYLDGAETSAFTWTSSTNIRLNSPLSAETVVLLIRKTEREYLYIEFASGAPFIEVNVDTQNKQFLHLAQELVEGRAIEGFYGDISFNGYRITNVGNPVAAADAANKGYVDTTVQNEASVRAAADAALSSTINSNFQRTLRVPESSVNILPTVGARKDKLLGFNSLGNPVAVLPESGSAADVLLDLASNVEGMGASLVAVTDGETVQEKLYKTELGTDSLRDSVTPGTLDTLLNSTAAGVVNLKEKKVVIPPGEFTAKRYLRNRGISADDHALEDFSLLGQGSRSTVLKMPSNGIGDHIYTDYMKRGYIGKLTLDNTDLPPGTTQANSKNGQVWVRYAEDFHFDDLVYKGGDVLSHCLGTCKNVLSTNIKVDYQYRYPSGYSKSPLIVGDFSEKCMFIGGYVRSVSPDGAVTYVGDLADNDQANDTKWAFINLLGLPYATRANANACMWQEGEDAPSNAHFIGMNYYGNGIGHGVSQQSTGTDIGCTFRENQVRSVWSSGRYVSLGCQFIDNKGLNTGGAAASNLLGAIHVDNGRGTFSMGDFFSGNLRDVQDLTGGTAHSYNTIHLTNNRHSAPIALYSGGNALHLGVVNSQLTEGSTVFSGNNRVHTAIVATHSVGSLGQFGNGSAQTVTDVIGCTLVSDGTDTTAITQANLGVINLNRCVIRDYTSGVLSSSSTTPANVTYEKCTFVNVTFTATDLAAKYIGCSFVSCTNAPNTLGLNFAADSFFRPSTARCEVTVAAGGTYTFPSWVMEGRGVYTIKIGGRGSDNHCAEFRISKGSAANNGTVTAIFESTAGKFSISWAGGALPTITFVDAGTYTVKLG